MRHSDQKYFSHPRTVFHDRRLPEPATPVGYAALIDGHRLAVPLPRRLYAIARHHRSVETPEWQLLTPRHAPDNTLAGHLTFALKREGVDLLVLKRLFLAVPPEEVAASVRRQPTGSYSRRIWFFYEWLTGRELPLPDAETGSYARALDPRAQFAVEGTRSRRHRVIDNLPGTPAFCPLVRRTKELTAFLELDLAARARGVIARIPADVLARTAAFLLLEDSKSSHAIEGERPARNRIERWGNAVGQAGKSPLDLDELLRLQHIVIGDSRFVPLGVREEGGFVGEHDRSTGAPIPSHISARPEDLLELLEGLIVFAESASRGLDAVIAAASTAFGFVYIHPFSDGNGRIHRYLIHQILGARGFSPPGLVFPVSAAVLREIDRYRRVLETVSRPLLPLIEWEATPSGNVRVSSDTADYYRYFDATPHAAFLFRCVQATIEDDLQRESAFLEAYDRFAAGVQEVVDMPANTLSLLFRFLRKNGGELSKRAREREFAALTGDETEAIELLYASEFPSAQGH